jgi:general secretion pathway protein D
MIKDLQPLLPTFANLTANESGNALVLTDIQSDIRRMVQIVKAIDASISSITAIRVFPLRYADAKDLVTELKEMFPTQSGSSGRGGNNGGPQAMMPQFGGGGGRGGGGGQGGTAGAGTGQSEAKQAASRVNAVADERTNSLVVTAPDDVMEVIERLVKEIDTSAESITRIKAFHLKNANPTELVDTLSTLFPDDTKSTSNTRSTFQFGGGGGTAQTTAASSRAKKQNRVLAVADLRTSRLIVTASSELMPFIEELIAELDADPAKKQSIWVYALRHANVNDVEPVLQSMFQSQNSRNSSGNSTTTDPLAQRQQNQGYGSTTTSSFGNSTSSSSSRRTGQ